MTDPVADSDKPDAEEGWWIKHSNLVTLTSWMATNGYTAAEVAYAVEKPWKHTDLFLKATGLDGPAVDLD